MLKRRRFIEAVSGALLALSDGAIAQARRTPRVGMLLFTSPASEPIGPLLDGLKEPATPSTETSPSTTASPRAGTSACPRWPPSWRSSTPT